MDTTATLINLVCDLHGAAAPELDCVLSPALAVLNERMGHAGTLRAIFEELDRRSNAERTPAQNPNAALSAEDIPLLRSIGPGLWIADEGVDGPRALALERAGLLNFTGFRDHGRDCVLTKAGRAALAEAPDEPAIPECLLAAVSAMLPATLCDTRAERLMYAGVDAACSVLPDGVTPGLVFSLARDYVKAGAS